MLENSTYVNWLIKAIARLFSRTSRFFATRSWRFASYAKYFFVFRIMGRSRERSSREVSSCDRHMVVCFYGIDRALEFTCWDIYDKIFLPLAAAGVRVTVVGHFNSVRTINSSNSREHGIKRSVDNIRFLDCDHLWIEQQVSSSIDPELKQVALVGWKENLPRFQNALNNLLFQLHSLSRCLQILKFSGLDQSNMFLILRADLRYLDPLPVSKILDWLEGDEYDVVVPEWQSWGGLNDRFVFLNRRALEPVLNRRNDVADFAEAHGYVHAEELLKFVSEKYSLKVGYTSIRAQRIRSGGRIASDWW